LSLSHVTDPGSATMKPGKTQLWGVILLLTSLKLLFLIIRQPGMTFYEDNDIAVNFSNTGEFFLFWDGIKNHTFQFPIYPSCLALLYTIFGIHPLVAGIFHVLLNALAAFLLWDIFHFFLDSFRLPAHVTKYNNTIVFIAIFLFCLHPGIAWYALFKIHPFSMDLLMLLLPIYFTARYWKNESMINLVLFFVSSALAVLTRATLIVAVVPFLILYLKQKGLLRATLLTASLFLFILLACLPWMIRNYHQDDIIGMSSLGGKDIWKGSLPETEGSNYLTNGSDCYSLLSPGAVDSIHQMTVKQQNNYFLGLYYKNVTERPGLQVRLFLLKLKNFWLFRSAIGNEYGSKAQFLLPLYKVCYLFILLLSIAALWLIGKRSLLLFIIPLLLSLEQSLYYVETRHRLLIEPFLIFLAITGLFYIYSGWNQKKRKT
jgi:hypothetical protein